MGPSFEQDWQKWGAECLHPTVEVDVPSDEMTIYQVVDLLIRPLLVAQGYSEELVKKVLGVEDE